MLKPTGGIQDTAEKQKNHMVYPCLQRDDKLKVELHNTRNGETETYQELQYTQVDGIYGYLCVDINFVVLFFYSDDEGMHVKELTHYQIINKPEQL
jgi:hypothetical protein